MGFGLDFEKLLVIGLIAVLLIGPERLPHYAEQFAKLVRRGGELLRDTKSRVEEEMGPEVADVDWRKLDPRQYDPRRIIRDALLEEPTPPTHPMAAAAAIAEPEPRTPPQRVTPGELPPFDLEAT